MFYFGTELCGKPRRDTRKMSLNIFTTGPAGGRQRQMTYTFSPTSQPVCQPLQGGAVGQSPCTTLLEESATRPISSKKPFYTQEFGFDYATFQRHLRLAWCLHDLWDGLHPVLWDGPFALPSSKTSSRRAAGPSSRSATTMSTTSSNGAASPRLAVIRLKGGAGELLVRTDLMEPATWQCIKKLCNA